MSEQVYLSPVAAQGGAAQSAQACCGQEVEKSDYSQSPSKVARPDRGSDNDVYARDIWVGRAHIYCESGVFYCHADSPAALTPAELTLLKVFYDRPGLILDRDQLSELSLGRKWDPWNRCVDNHVSHLRRKIGTDPMDPGLIRTIRGKGYVYMP